MSEFLCTCIFVRWFNVAVVDGLQQPAMFVVAPEIGKRQKCLAAINQFMLTDERYEEWHATEFCGKIIVGRSTE